jgi:hypothetical protein
MNDAIGRAEEGGSSLQWGEGAIINHRRMKEVSASTWLGDDVMKSVLRTTWSEDVMKKLSATTWSGEQAVKKGSTTTWFEERAMKDSLIRPRIREET